MQFDRPTTDQNKETCDVALHKGKCKQTKRAEMSCDVQIYFGVLMTNSYKSIWNWLSRSPQLAVMKQAAMAAV